MPLLMATLNFQPFITMQAKKRHFHLQLPPAEHRLRISIQDQTHHPFAPRSHGPLHLEHPPAWDKHESPLRLFLTPIFPRKGRKKKQRGFSFKARHDSQSLEIPAAPRDRPQGPGVEPQQRYRGIARRGSFRREPATAGTFPSTPCSFSKKKKNIFFSQAI